MILALLAFVLTLILVIGIHEAGHAMAACLFKVKIRRISIGFGKPLMRWRDKSGREWVWALWPLGGYVQLLNSRIEPVLAKDFSNCFDKKSAWQRFIILIAGVIANLITAWFALTIMLMIGYSRQIPVIEAIIPHSIAAKAQLKANDRIIAIAKEQTNSWQEVGMSLIRSLGKAEVPMMVQDDKGVLKAISLNLSQWHYDSKAPSLFLALGMKPAFDKMHRETVAGQHFFHSSLVACRILVKLFVFYLVMLKLLITGVLPFAILLGPVGFLTISISSFLQGIAVFMYFIATLSIAVCLVNLFPIPGLDGGLIIYLLVEKCRGKPLSVAMEILLQRLAVIVFVLLLIQLLMNDLQRFLNSSRTAPNVHVSYPLLLKKAG